MKKHKQIVQYNQAGIAHFVVPLIIVMMAGLVGTYLLVASHADSPGSKYAYGKTVPPPAPSANEGDVRARAASVNGQTQDVVLGSNVYVVKKNYTKTSGGKGVWIANNDNGYYIGRAFPGDRVQVVKEKNSCQDGNPNRCELWVYGLVKSTAFIHKKRTSPVYTYGWLKKDNLTLLKASSGKTRDATLKDARVLPVKITNNEIISAQEDNITPREAIGTAYNCPPHVCTGGTPVTIKKCVHNTEFYNVVIDADGKLHPYDPAGHGRKGKRFEYRFMVPIASADGLNYDVGRDEKNGWVYIADQCIPDGDRQGTPGVT